LLTCFISEYAVHDFYVVKKCLLLDLLNLVTVTNNIFVKSESLLFECEHLVLCVLHVLNI